MRGSTSRSHSAVTLTAAALIALGSTGCETTKKMGEAAAKPLKAVGEAAAKPFKAANPMRLFKKDKGDENAIAEADLAEGVDAVTPGGTPAGIPAPSIDAPSRNTLTPGAQPAPGVVAQPRESLTLPSNPDLAPTRTPGVAATPGTALDPLPEQPSTSPSILEQPPAIPAVTDPGPLSTPPKLVTDDDGFLQLAPKLPEEEDILPPG